MRNKSLLSNRLFQIITIVILIFPLLASSQAKPNLGGPPIHDDKIGLYDPVTSRWFLKPANVGGSIGVNKFYYGPAGGGRIPISGDWNGNGAHTAGMYDPVTSRWFLLSDNIDGGGVVTKFYWGPPGGGRLPIVGDWDMNGVETVGLYDPATSRWFVNHDNVGGWAGVTI